MEFRDALSRAAYYKAVSWVGALVGIALVLAGYYVAIGGVPANRAAAVDNATSPAVVGAAVLGFVVWQLASTVAFYRSLVEAVDAALADRFDPEVVKSDILSVLDERLADMQTQLEGTRRAVEDAGGPTTGPTGTGPGDAGTGTAPGTGDAGTGTSPGTGEADDQGDGGEFEFEN
jgi:hypothetical protein